MFRRVTIIGVGFMGGSLGLALKKHQLAREIIGVSQRQASLMTALKMNAIDQAESDVAKAVQNADLVVLATPVQTILQFLPLIHQHVRRGCIVTDIGSIKIEITETAERILKEPSFFVGSHPLAGSEKSGVENARADLFENSVCIMTPTNLTNQVAKEKVKHLWAKLGAQVKFLSPSEHDEIFGFISHMPHLMAFGLMESIPPQFFEYATQGLKDTTRIASSSPQMWNDIALANSKNILKALDELVKQFSTMRKAIIDRDQNALVHLFTKAKEKRDGIQPPTS
jgi:prephenate dehydrogenase